MSAGAEGTRGVGTPPPAAPALILASMASPRSDSACPDSPAHNSLSQVHMTTEHLALIGFTARMGAEATNEDAEQALTREEARLLMSLLGQGLSGGGRGDRCAIAAGPVSPLVVSAEEIRVLNGTDETTNEGAAAADFKFLCPSLSIADAPCEFGGPSPSSSAAKQEPDDARPSVLLGRPVSATSRDQVKGVADTVATNVMRSFGGAVLWRGRSWIESLMRVASLRDKVAAARDAREGGCGKRLREEFNEEGRMEEVEKGKEVEEIDDKTKSQEAAAKEGSQEDSNELKVIYALARSISQVKIRGVKTSYRVLPQKFLPGQEVPQGNQDVNEFILAPPSRTPSPCDPSMPPPPPKKRHRIISASPDLRDHAQVVLKPREIPRQGQYQVAHGLQFKAVLNLTIACEDGTDAEHEVVLRAPGTIVGTFSDRYPGTEGTEVLRGVEVGLETDVLALSMERQSRLVLRRAAEADMLASITSTSEPPTPGASIGANQEESAYTLKPSNPTEAECSLYYTQYESSCDSPKAAIVSPKHHVMSPTLSSNSSRHSLEELSTLPPATHGMTNWEHHPPTPGQSSSPAEFVHSTPGAAAAVAEDRSYLFSPGPAGTQGCPSAFPSLVSPSPTASRIRIISGGGGQGEIPYAPPQDEGCAEIWHSPKGRGLREGFSKRDGGPSLPALVEVACAAMHQQ